MKAFSIYFVAVISTLAAQSFGAGKTVTVSAGDYDRRNTVVTVPWPAKGGMETALLAGQGKTFALQIREDGTASFVLDELGKGKDLKLEVKQGAPRIKILSARKNKAKVNLGPENNPWLEYQAEPSELPRENIKAEFRRGAYLHPIRTLSGTVVTDDYPQNHIHHHGVWWAWTHTAFDGRAPDFWNMGQGKGKVDFADVDKTWSGPVHAGFVSRHRFNDLTASAGAEPKPIAVLNETWKVRAYNNAGPSGLAPGAWIFDLESVQECATDKPLKLPEYHYGGLGFRGHWDWNGKTNCFFLTSEGETDRAKGHGTRARWCDISGVVDGARAGVAILCHPENFRAPQHMRLHPSEPFFCYVPQQGGDMEIAPGKAYVSRYRFVVHDGAPDKALIERMWNDYAHPPFVRIN